MGSGRLAVVDAARLRAIAGRQQGLFTQAQAIRCGFSAKQVRGRVRAGQWRRVRGRVLAAGEVRLNPELRDRAAQLAVPGSVLAGPSAARFWGIDLPDVGPVLTVGRRTGADLAGVRVMPDPVERSDVVIVDGTLVTSRERTIVDSLRLLTEPQARDLLDRALQRRWITLDELCARVRSLAGRRGAPRLARLVRGAVAGTRFAAERLTVDLLRRAGIEGWSANVEISDRHGLIGVADLVFGAARLIVELDGMAFHVTPDQFQRDRARQNRLVAAGWTVLRFTWRDLTERPGYVIGAIRDMLGGAA